MRGLKTFEELAESTYFYHDKDDDCLRYNPSQLLVFSHYWIDRFVGQTEEQIRSQIKVVDGWEITLPEELFGDSND